MFHMGTRESDSGILDAAISCLMCNGVGKLLLNQFVINEMFRTNKKCFKKNSENLFICVILLKRGVLFNEIIFR